MNSGHVLPWSGEIFFAPKRQYDTAIILVHNYGTSKKTFKYHIPFFHQLGFDTIVFNLDTPADRRRIFFPVCKTGWGLRSIYTQRITDILRMVNRPKIIMSLSMPASCALSAAVTCGFSGIRAMVCECGPSAQLFSCASLLLRHYFNIRRAVIRIPFAALLQIFWHPFHNVLTRKDTAAIPENFPVLSVRSGLDKIIPEKFIAELFQNTKAKVTVLRLPSSGHLDGFHFASELYRPVLTEFLIQHA